MKQTDVSQPHSFAIQLNSVQRFEKKRVEIRHKCYISGWRPSIACHLSTTQNPCDESNKWSTSPLAQSSIVMRSTMYAIYFMVIVLLCNISASSDLRRLFAACQILTTPEQIIHIVWPVVWTRIRWTCHIVSPTGARNNFTAMRDLCETNSRPKCVKFHENPA